MHNVVDLIDAHVYNVYIVYYTMYSIHCIFYEYRSEMPYDEYVSNIKLKKTKYFEQIYIQSSILNLFRVE